MLTTEFVRSLNHNYERMLLNQKPEERKYQYCILGRGGIKGLLPCSLRYIDGLSYLYYDITSRQSLAQLYQRRCLSRRWIQDFVWGIGQLQQELERFLLDYCNVLWQPEQIFQELERNVFSLTVLGEKGANTVCRSGAENGDIIFISRPLGLCRISLEKELNSHPFNIYKYYHYQVNAEDKLGAYLGNIKGITSMTDISDGLGVDLNNIALSSNKKAIIEYNKLDLSHLAECGINSFDYFLSSGEEFALLFTVKSFLAQKIQKDILDFLNINIIPVGRIEEGNGIFLEKDGHLQKIRVAGYEHFSKKC